MFDKVLHQWLKIPYRLHVGVDTGARNTKTTVVFLHGLGSSNKMWQQTIEMTSLEGIRVLAIDLLGFGDSPKPHWQTYTPDIHARALAATLRKRSVRGKLIIVGHSLGSLVAVQLAAHNRRVDALVLCSPPLYRAPDSKSNLIKIPQLDDFYRRLYKYTRSRQELARRVALIIKQARLIDPHFTVNDDTLPAIASSLELSIENQTTLHDLERLTIPIDIIYGRLDPFIVARNFRLLQKKNPHIAVSPVVAAHDVINSKAYTSKIGSILKERIAAV